MTVHEFSQRLSALVLTNPTIAAREMVMPDGMLVTDVYWSPTFGAVVVTDDPDAEEEDDNPTADGDGGCDPSPASGA